MVALLIVLPVEHRLAGLCDLGSDLDAELADQRQQGVVNAHPQQPLELAMHATFGRLLDLHGHRLLESAGPRKADVTLKPDPSLIECRDVLERRVPA